MIEKNKRPRILVTCSARIPSVELGAIIPLTHLQKQGFCQINYKDEGLLSLDDITWCDVLFIVRGASVQSVWAAASAKKLQRKVLGYWDDDLLSIPNHSLTYGYYSKPETKRIIERLFNMTDYFFSPNPKLAAKLSVLHGKAVKVLPVTFGPERLRAHSKKRHDAPIIGYASSADNIHLLNSFLGPVFEALVRNDIHCNIHIVGPRPNFIDKLKDRVKYTSYIENYYDYAAFASRLNWDIGLAPQAASEFTSYKFYNKFLEYTLIGCAGIYSKLEPYTNVIQDGVTGLLVDNEVGAWSDAIVRLLKEPELRIRIVSNAYELVQSSHNTRVVAEQYAIALKNFLGYRAPEIRHGLKALIIGCQVRDKIFLPFSAIFTAILYPSTIIKSLRILGQQGPRALFAKISRSQKLRKQYDLYQRAKKSAEFPHIFPHSALAHKYCVGKGLEIGGSAHNPFGLDTMNVDFTDSMETVSKREEIRLCGSAAKVDIVAYGDNIPLPGGSQDFVVSSHVLEHFPNPIKALLEWDRLIRPGGIIFMIVPHKNRTFDKLQPRTSLQHLIDDFLSDNKSFHDKTAGHDHCWITKDIVALTRWMIDALQVRWKIVKVQDVDDKVGNGFTIVIRKKGDRVIKRDLHLANSQGEFSKK